MNHQEKFITETSARFFSDFFFWGGGGIRQFIPRKTTDCKLSLLICWLVVLHNENGYDKAGKRSFTYIFIVKLGLLLLNTVK